MTSTLSPFPSSISLDEPFDEYDDYYAHDLGVLAERSSSSHKTVMDFSQREDYLVERHLDRYEAFYCNGKRWKGRSPDPARGRFERRNAISQHRR